MKNIYFFRVLAFSLVVFGMGYRSVSAASYDYYVKDGSSGNGSESDPFGSIADALSEAASRGGKKIFVASGSYGDAITLSKGIEIVGDSAKSVTITGFIQMGDKSKLSGITAERSGVLVLSDADATISKIKVKNMIGVGIKAEEGNGTITVKDTVIEGSRKGMYLQKGNNIRLENLRVIDNLEEGVDIRENVSGSISKSDFRDNGESGIEVVLGSSDLVIASNTFSGNGASGIATQYFQGSRKIGDTTIRNNTFNNNSNYGIDCKTPQGGQQSKEYFLNSIQVSGNAFSKNKEGDMAGRCHILTDEERQELEKIKEAEKSANASLQKVFSPEMLQERAQQDVDARREYDDTRETQERQFIKTSLMNVAVGVEAMRSVREDMRKRSLILCFVAGNDVQKEQSLKQSLEKMAIVKERLIVEGATLEFESNTRFVDDVARGLNDFLGETQDMLANSKCREAPLIWLNKRIFGAKDPVRIITDDSAAQMSLYADSGERTMLLLGSVSYGALNRGYAFTNGDSAFLANIQDRLRSYDKVVASSVSPVTGQDDSAVAQSSSVSFPLPERFLNILSAHNIRFMHIGKATLPAYNLPSVYSKTVATMLQSHIESFGNSNLTAASVSNGAIASDTMENPEAISDVKTIMVRGFPVTFIEYVESKTQDNEISTREKIQEAVQSSNTVIVYLSFDTRISTTITDERKRIARSFIESGASVVVGTGLPLTGTYESETVGAGRIYYSLGGFWDGRISNLDRSGTALEIVMHRDGQPAFHEKIVSVDSDGKILLTDTE